MKADLARMLSNIPLFTSLRRKAPAKPRAAAAEGAAELPVVAVVLEQAARAMVLRAATAASFDKRVILKSSFGRRTGGGSSPPVTDVRDTTCPVVRGQMNGRQTPGGGSRGASGHARGRAVIPRLTA